MQLADQRCMSVMLANYIEFRRNPTKDKHVIIHAPQQVKNIGRVGGRNTGCPTVAQLHKLQVVLKTGWECYESGKANLRHPRKLDRNSSQPWRRGKL